MHKPGAIDLLLFCRDISYAQASVQAGMNAIVVDWEWRGKDDRQRGRGTEINYGTVAEFRNIREAVPGHVICRVNNLPAIRQQEVREAADLGADEIWLPMVRHISEVEECLETLDGRASLGVLVETREALEIGPVLEQLPLTRVFIGLNDLHIDLGTANLFTVLCDGTIERFRQQYHGRFGFAGFTVPGKGNPVPCRLLLAEMARLSCSFAVARRAFRADVPIDGIQEALFETREVYSGLLARSTDSISSDYRELQDRVKEMDPPKAIMAGSV